MLGPTGDYKGLPETYGGLPAPTRRPIKAYPRPSGAYQKPTSETEPGTGTEAETDTQTDTETDTETGTATEAATDA